MTDETKDQLPRLPTGLTIEDSKGCTFDRITMVGVSARAIRPEDSTFTNISIAATAKQAAAFEQTKTMLAEELAGLVLNTDRKIDTELLIRILRRLSQPDAQHVPRERLAEESGLRAFLGGSADLTTLVTNVIGWMNQSPNAREFVTWLNS